MNNVYTLVEEQFENPLTKAMFDSKLAQNADTQEKDQMWEKMVYWVAGNVTTPDEFAMFEVDHEQEFVDKAEEGDVITKKNGTINASKTFPKHWNNNCPVIRAALKYGKPLLDVDGKFIPKSKMEASYKDDKASDPESTTYKTAMEKIQTVINAFNALYPELSSDEQDMVNAMLVNNS